MRLLDSGYSGLQLGNVASRLHKSLRDSHRRKIRANTRWYVGLKNILARKFQVTERRKTILAHTRGKDSTHPRTSARRSGQDAEGQPRIKALLPKAGPQSAIFSAALPALLMLATWSVGKRFVRSKVSKPLRTLVCNFRNSIKTAALGS